jgi:hypothetical protein
MCRAPYLLEHGEVAAKADAAAWAQRACGEPWVGLIGWAAAWRRGMQALRLEETLAFIEFTLDRCGIQVGLHKRLGVHNTLISSCYLLPATGQVVQHCFHPAAVALERFAPASVNVTIECGLRPYSLLRPAGTHIPPAG